MFDNKARWGDKLWTEEDVTSLKKDYSNRSISSKDFEKRYNRKWLDITNKAQTLGLKRRKIFNHKIDSVQIIKMYNEGNGTTEITKVTGWTVGTILKCLRDSNITIRPLSEEIRKYTLNEHYFDKIDTPEKAYFLGLLYADGCNHEKNNCVSISLQDCDKEILEKLNILIDSNRPLALSKGGIKPDSDTYGIRQDKWILCISSKHLSQQLAKHGCVQAKSLILQFPYHINKKLYPHFTRGMFDGDGCVVYSKNKLSYSIEANKDFLLGLQRILINQIGVGETLLYSKETSKSYALRYSGSHQVTRIMEWMYKNSTIHMKRKYDKWNLIKENLCTKLNVFDIKTGIVYENAKIVSEKFNISLTALLSQLKGRRENKSNFILLKDYKEQQKLAI